VGSEIGHRISHARRVRPDVVRPSRAGGHLRDRAAALPRRLYATASVPSGRLPADAETLAFALERKRAQRKRDFTPTPLDEDPRATLLPVGCWSRPPRGAALDFMSNDGWPATLAYDWTYKMTLQRVDESGNAL
jgi:hypothetical protein